MVKTKLGHHQHVDHDSDNHGVHRPYWKHAHHDWRLWVAVSVMLVAMLTHVVSDDRAWRPHGQMRQSASGAS